MLFDTRKLTLVSDVVPMPTLPNVLIVIAVVAPLLPTLNAMLSVVPTPLVDWSVRDEDAVVPPIRSGVVSEVVSVGEAE